MHNRNKGTIALAALCLCLAVAPVWGSRPQYRDGFFLGFGFGAGVARWDWTDPDLGDGPREGSGTFNARAGYAVRDDLILGVDSVVWRKRWKVFTKSGVELGSATVSLGTIALAATYFPGNMGLYIRGGVGLGLERSSVTDSTAALLQIPEGTTCAGLGLLGATGYEWRVTDKFAIGPQVGIAYLPIESELIKDAVIGDVSVQFNWYW